MSRSRHFPAYDFDCDDSGRDEDPSTAPWPPDVQRRVRSRHVVGEGIAERVERLVQCPFRDRWPTFQECLECEHWRSYARDPSGASSFMRCARQDELRWPTPLGPNERSRAMRTRVRDVMRDPVCVRENLPLEELAALLVGRGIGTAPVTDAEGRTILGVVSKTDVVAARAGRVDAEGTEQHPSTLTVADLMTPAVLSLEESASIAEAAALMAAKGVTGVPIVSRSGEVVGVVMAIDIACWLSSPEGQWSAPCPAGL